MNTKRPENPQTIDIENLYRHVLALEGVRHPLEAPQSLARAAAYLSAGFHQAGVQVRLQPFKVEGFEEVFYNVEGWTGAEDEPAAVLLAHYDTVWNDPGANDNAASLAVMLEIARALGSLGADAPPVRLLAVSLEEGNPAFEQARRESLRRLELVDERYRCRSHDTARLLENLTEFTLAALWSGETYLEGYTRFSEHHDDLPEAILAHLEDLATLQGRFTALTSVGAVNRVGSAVWLREALRAGRRPRYAICLDEIGTVVDRPHAQQLPPQISLERTRRYRVDLELRSGDFILAITDEDARAQGTTFLESCQDPEIDLPCLWLPLPGTGPEVARAYPQVMGSDHAPFWLAGIPAVSITDTAYLRNPFSHTPADTIDRVDFSQVQKVGQSVLKLLLR